MILSERHKFIYFCNSKTGTTSVEKALRHLDEGDRYRFGAPGLFGARHIPPVMVRALMPGELWRSCFKFTFVRNPYDWVVSQWFHNFTGAKRPNWLRHPIGRLRHHAGGFRRILGRTRRDLDAMRDKVFTPADVRFLHEFLQDYRVLPAQPAKLQAHFLLDPDGKELVDFVGRFERLDRDFTHAMEKIGQKGIELPHERRTLHRDYRAYFTTESAAEVARIWARDFEVLGYSTDLHAP